MNVTRNKRLSSVLGLTLDNGRMEAALVTRTNGSVEIKKHVDLGLSLDLMRNEPELAGHEIRNLLDEAGIKERRSVVGVPAEWFLSMHTMLPEGLTDEDLDGFVELEAEQSFPTSPANLQRANSPHHSAAAKYMTQLAVSNDQIRHFEAILAAAQLRPIRLSLAIAALPGAIAADDQGGVTLVVGEQGVTVLFSVGGGIVALRNLNNVMESESNERRILADVVAREIRVTLSQLPDDLRACIGQLRIVGTGSMTDHLIREIQPRAEKLGLSLSRLTSANGTEHGLKVKGESPLSGAVSLAVQRLAEDPRAMNFLPPKPTLWQQFSRRYSGKRLAYTGATAGAVAAVFLAVLLFQAVQLSGLNRDWAAIEPKVSELETLQNDIRAYRPWLDPDVTILEILKDITETFPEDGIVTAKTIEIVDQTHVSISGVTDNTAAYYAVTDKMSTMAQFHDVKRGPSQGRTPISFSFESRWVDQ